MGAQESSERLNGPPGNVAEFRKIDDPTNNFIIPELPMNRKVTDKKYAIGFGLFILFFMPFLIYTLANSNFNKMVKDFANNSGGGESRFLSDVANDLRNCAGKITSICVFGLCVSVGMLFLFRYFTAVVVWGILIGSMLGVFGLTIFVWSLAEANRYYADSHSSISRITPHNNYAHNIMDDGYNNNYNGLSYSYSNSEITRHDTNELHYLAIFLTCVSLILIVIIACMAKRIKLVIRLLRESITAIFGIPLILFEPLLTSLALIILYIIYFFVLFCMESSRTISSGYELNGVTTFSFFYHSVIVIWMHRFIIGCQHMVISGAVSGYYFTRDKASLSPMLPIYNSFYNLFKYHLGTVALGSLLLTLIASLKALIRRFINNRLIRCILEDCCITRLEVFLKFISENAYIQTAMHGQPFFRSAKRAVQLLATNALSVVAVNCVGDFVLGIAKLIICLITILFAILIKDNDVTYYWLGALIAVLVTMIIANCFFTVFETAIDTLFLCFCEDMCMNDGEQQPYYMSVNLMQYVDDAKKVNIS